MQGKQHLWRIVVCVVSITTASLSFAAEEPDFGLYGGMDYQFVRVNGEYENFDVNALGFLGGKALNDHWAIEGYFSLGLGDDSKSSTRGCVEETFELDNLLGLQIKGHTQLSADLSAWFTFGIAQTSVSSSVRNACPINVGFRGYGADESESDLSYGLGGELRVTPDSSITLGFIQYYDDGIGSDELTVRGINLGFRVNF